MAERRSSAKRRYPSEADNLLPTTKRTKILVWKKNTYLAPSLLSVEEIGTQFAKTVPGPTIDQVQVLPAVVAQSVK